MTLNQLIALFMGGIGMSSGFLSLRMPAGPTRGLRTVISVCMIVLGSWWGTNHWLPPLVALIIMIGIFMRAAGHELRNATTQTFPLNKERDQRE